MIKSVKSGVVAIAAGALVVSLAGCGSDTKTDKSSTESTTSSAAAATTTSAEAAPPTSGKVTGPNYTIVDYIRDNGITETPVKRGDPGSPTIDLPVPEGWEDAGARTPDWAYGAIVSTDPGFTSDPPSIMALVSKLTGNVDPNKVLEFAPGEIRNLPGFEGSGEGTEGELSGFDAMQVGGTYKKDGVTRAIAQKTVVIPGKDGLYVLQLNADGLEDQLGALGAATVAIDEQTTITP
jgi:hypothetical protein